MNQPGICYTSNYMTFAAAGNGGIVVPAVLFCEICGPAEHLLRKTRRPPVFSLVGGLCIGGYCCLINLPTLKSVEKQHVELSVA